MLKRLKELVEVAVGVGADVSESVETEVVC